MNGDLSFWSLLWMYALMLVPLGIFHYLRLGIIRDTLISLLRMTVQLLLVGLYLKYVFQLNNPFVSIGWVAVMLVVANLSILNKAKRNPMKKRGEEPVRVELHQFCGMDLTSIDGISSRTAETILSELGIDLGSFPNEKHFVSYVSLGYKLLPSEMAESCT